MNLFELYRAHRDEIDVLADPNALFILGLTNHVGSMRATDLARELGRTVPVIHQQLAPLLRGRLMLDKNGALTVTPLGKQLLTEIGLAAPPLAGPGQPPQEPPPTAPPAAPAAGGGWGVFAFAGFIALVGLFFLILILWPQPPPPTPTLVAQATETPRATPVPPDTSTATSWPTDTPAPSNTSTATLWPSDTPYPPTDTPTATLWPSDTPYPPTDTPTSTPWPTDTPTLTPAPQYDLYVRRMDFSPPNPMVGQAVSLFIMIATDIYPSSGPYFPASHFRWRSSEYDLWNEEACPADYHYSQCSRTVSFSYDKPGTYNAQVQADNRDEVYETDKSNNSRSYPVTVSFGTGTLTGKVSTAADGSLIPNAQVQLSGNLDSMVPADSGSYVMPNLAVGTYTVFGRAPGYNKQIKYATIYQGLTTTLDFTLTKAYSNAGANVTLNSEDCFDFDQGVIQPAPPGSEFFTCPLSGDIQATFNALYARNNAHVAKSFGSNNSYESCPTFFKYTQTQIPLPPVGTYICIYTATNRTAVMLVDSTSQGFTFDWWLY